MAVFKRANGHIFGVQFSAKEQKAIDAEILRQCAEYDKKNADEVDAVILWLLHEKFGFGSFTIPFPLSLTHLLSGTKWVTRTKRGSVLGN